MRFINSEIQNTEIVDTVGHRIIIIIIVYNSESKFIEFIKVNIKEEKIRAYRIL